MSLAENLLDEISSNSRIAGSYADEPHIVINDLRQIIIPASLKTVAVTGDKDIETLTFDCVRYWDGYDLASFAIYINYTLPNGKDETYIPSITNRDVSVFSFNWTIGIEMTEIAGRISFNITAVDTDENGLILHQWSSLTNGELNVSKGIPVGEIPEVSESPDVVSQILSEINKLKISNDETTKKIGDIDVALDSILEIQDELLGGAS